MLQNCTRYLATLIVAGGALLPTGCSTPPGESPDSAPEASGSKPQDERRAEPRLPGNEPGLNGARQDPVRELTVTPPEVSVPGIQALTTLSADSQDARSALATLTQSYLRQSRQDAELAFLRAQEQEAQEEVDNSLEGFNFGAGIGATFDLQSGNQITSASIGPDRNGSSVVRVDDDDDTNIGLILESHYFFTSGEGAVSGHGPFVAIKSSGDDIIDEGGIGYMMGFRRKDSTRSFNIGVGVMVDPDATVLADGFERGVAPPPGSMDVETREETRFSLAVIFSYTF